MIPKQRRKLIKIGISGYDVLRSGSVNLPCTTILALGPLRPGSHREASPRHHGPRCPPHTCHTEPTQVGPDGPFEPVCVRSRICAVSGEAVVTPNRRTPEVWQIRPLDASDHRRLERKSYHTCVKKWPRGGQIRSSFGHDMCFLSLIGTCIPANDPWNSTGNVSPSPKNQGSLVLCLPPFDTRATTPLSPTFKAPPTRTFADRPIKDGLVGDRMGDGPTG